MGFTVWYDCEVADALVLHIDGLAQDCRNSSVLTLNVQGPS